MKLKNLFPAIAMIVIATGCSSSADGPEIPEENNDNIFVLKDRRDIALTEESTKAVAMQNDFSFSLLKSIYSQKPETEADNYLVSPLSINTVLSMAANGASDEVQNEIVDKLMPDNGSLTTLNELNKNLMDELFDLDNSSSISMTNAIWAHKKYTLLTQFEANVAKFYNAETGITDLHSMEGANVINDWVNKASEGLIPSLYDDEPNCELVIANSLYFKGSWTTPFKPENTKKGEFTNADGTKVKVDFMDSDSEDFAAVISTDYSIAKLPYGNEAFALYAVLPSENSNLNEVISSLNKNNWSEVRHLIGIDRSYVVLPKFEANYSNNEMMPAMINAGIEKLFTGYNTLSKAITPAFEEGVVKMMCKSVFKIDEVGAEGASASHLDLWATAGPNGGGSTIKTITFNRPFLYIVEERSSGAILFMGTVNNL